MLKNEEKLERQGCEKCLPTNLENDELVNSNGFSLYVYEGELNYSYNGKFERVQGFLKISYCPACGKKLSEYL